MRKNNDKNGLKWLIYLILGGFLIKFLRFVFKGDNEKKIARNFKDFFKKEKREVEEFAAGEESFGEYCKDSGSIFKNYFIPNDDNDFKPKILRTKPLAVIAVTLLFFKISVAGYLFFIYPNLAKMSEVIQDEVYNLINIERKKNNVPVLSANEKLNEIAKKKAEDMINKNYFAHKSPDGKMIWDMIDRDEYPYLYVGENLAMNFTSAQSVSKALMRSPSHKRNILNPKYTDVGVAVVPGEINGKKTNVLVELFAYAKRPKPALAVAPAPKEKTSSPAAAPALSAEKKPPVKPIKRTKPTPPPSVNGAEQAVEPAAADNGAEPSAPESRVLAAEIEADNGAKKENETKEDARRPIAKEDNGKDIAENGNRNTIEQSPNKELEARATVKATAVEVPREYDTASKLVNYSQYVFIGALVLLVLLLLVNILVRISVQHKPVIIQTLLLIIFLYGMITIKFNFLRYITEKILVL